MDLSDVEIYALIVKLLWKTIFLPFKKQACVQQVYIRVCVCALVRVWSKLWHRLVPSWKC